jgi:hypothetical protein
MVIETPNWNEDKFGSHIESTNRYFRRRESQKYAPVEGETLANYYTRLSTNIIPSLEETNTGSHIYGRKMWFTHRTPSECWICEELNVLWFMVDILDLLPFKENYQFVTEKGKLTLKPL